MLKNTDHLLPPENTSMNVELLSRDLYTYANYAHIVEQLESTGSGYLKESKDFYGFRILQALSKFFEGKTQEDIKMFLCDWVELLETY